MGIFRIPFQPLGTRDQFRIGLRLIESRDEEREEPFPLLLLIHHDDKRFSGLPAPGDHEAANGLRILEA
jgi:hypothetical protein